MKKILVAALVLGLGGAMTAGAALIFNSGATAPAINDADIANLNGTGSWKVFTDAANPGQTFTTGSNAGGYTLSSYSFRHHSTSSDPKNPLTWSMRLVNATDPNATTTLAYETGVSYPDTWVTGDWITFSFTSPVSLAASTTYGVDAEVTGGSWGQGIPYLYVSSTSEYPDGTRYSKADGDPSAISETSGEMVFHLDIATVPEPATLSMLGVLGLALVARRRLQR